MDYFCACADALDSIRLVSFRFRPTNNDLVGVARLIFDSFENMRLDERQLILEMVDPTLSPKLLGLSGFLAEAAVNLNDESIIRVAITLHVIDDFRCDVRENIKILVLIFFASRKLGVDFRSIVLSLDRVCSDRSRKYLSDFLLRDDDLNRLGAFGLRGEVVDGFFRFSPVC